MLVSPFVGKVLRTDLGLPFCRLRFLVRVLSVMLSLQVVLVKIPYRPFLRSDEDAL